MNVLDLFTTVILTLIAPTLLDHSCVLVIMGTLEMELFVKVSLKNRIEYILHSL
jgi:hypothetical protein